MLLFAKRETGASPYKAAMAAIYARSPSGSGTGSSWIDGELIFATAGDATNGARQRMVINEEGLVGIGTNAPAEILEVVSDSDPTILIRPVTVDSANSGKISYRENAGGTTGVDLRYDGANNKFIIDTSDVTNALVIKRTDGNVGIGTNAPAAKLHVVGSSTTGIDVEGESTHYLRIIGNDETHPTQSLAGARIIAPDARRLYFELQGNDVTDHFRFLTSPNNDKAADYVAVHIGNNCNVGIGTDAPTGRFQVHNDGSGIKVLNEDVTGQLF